MTKRGVHFEAQEIQGSEDAAWCRWITVGGAETLEGVGIYKVSNGKLTFYRDYYRYDLPEEEG